MKKSLLLLISISLLQIFNAKAQGIDKPRYIIETHRAGVFLGNIEIELFPLIAPLATNYFDSLVNFQAYDSTAFHRVVPGFVIQGGDPNSINGPISTWGYGNPNQPTVNAEFSVVQHKRGRIGAARDTDTNSATSQFYICAAAALFLDGQYTVYGQVTAGLNIVDSIVNSPRDANDVPLQKIEMFITHNGVNDSIPDAPALVLPADNAINVASNQSFQWTTVSSAVMYTLEFSTDSNFATITTWKNAATTSTTITGLAGYTTYYWRVKANNGGHESVYSNIYKITTVTGAPILISPADSATNVFMNPVFNWNAVTGATAYTLQVSTFTTFTPGTMVYNQAGLTGTSQQVSGLLANKKYYWRVQSFNGTIGGTISAKFQFTTGTSLGLDNVKGTSKNISIKSIYPNPVKDVLHVTVAIKHPCPVAFNLKNNTGKIVYSSIKQIAKTDYNTTIDVSKLNKGIYFLTVSADGEEVTEKVEVN